MSSFEDDNEVRRRVGKCRSFLKSLQKCKTFEELKSMCADIYGQIDEVKGFQREAVGAILLIICQKHTFQEVCQREVMHQSKYELTAIAYQLVVVSLFSGMTGPQHKSEQELLLSKH